MVPIYHESPELCEYLPEETKQNILFFAPPLSSSTVEQLISYGFRHFGNFWFKPQCPSCRKCRGISIDCENFTPTKSQRKLLRKNSDLRFSVHEVKIDKEHLDLINRYHKYQATTFSWREQEFTQESYAESFVHHMNTAKEYQVRNSEGALCAVGIIDCTEELQSSVYLYYDPSYRKKSIGIWTILKEIELCQKRGRRWLHLGLFNKEARTLNYKGNFHPYELLPYATTEENAEAILYALSTEL